MNTTTVLTNLKMNKMALYMIRILELTGHMFTPPGVLKDGDSFDYVVVGGGTAGCVIATRLAQHNFNVLLIEAGGDTPYESTLPGLVTTLKNSRSDWNCSSVIDKRYLCHTNNQIGLSQGKTLGGTGSLNYMIYSRGNPSNYDKWYNITGDPTWKWSNVQEYFKKAESVVDNSIMNSSLKNVYGSKGYMGVTREKGTLTDDFLKGFYQVGEDSINDIDGNRVGYSRGLVFIKDGMRQNTATQYLPHILNNTYILAARGTLATKIIFDEYRNATGVRVITDDNRTITIKVKREVILSAGAIKTPQILQLSGLGPAEDLVKLNITCVCDLPVGKNLQDHTATLIPHATNKAVVEENANPGDYPAGLFVGYASLNKTCHHHTNKSIDYETMGFIINNMEFMCQFLSSTFDYPSEICDTLYNKTEGNQVLISLVSNLNARSRGDVSLKSTNPRDNPKVTLNSLLDERDLDDMVKFVKDYRKVEKSEAFKKLGANIIDLTSSRCNVFKKGSRQYLDCQILCSMVSMGHYSGTCAMGSVVDSKLRLKCVNKVRVADASVMPTIPSGNIYSAVIMIAEKVADFIIKDAGLYNDAEHEKIKTSQLRNLPRYL